MSPGEIILSLVLFLNLSSSSPVDVQNGAKAVNLSYACLKVATNDQNEQLPPVLLLHGLSGYKETWQGLPMVISLKTGRRVCMADLRNHGESPWSDTSDIESMASDLNPLLKTLKTDKVILLGHSLGGKISAHFALTNPEKVEKLIVEDMRPNGLSEQANKELLFFLRILYDSINSLPNGIGEKEARIAVFKYIKEIFDKMNKSFTLDESSDGILPITCTKEKCRFKFNIEVFKKYLETDKNYFTLSTGLFDKPTLFIYGSLSSFKVGEDREAILKLFPKAKLVPVEGAGHIVNVKPQFTDEVIKFINSED